MADEALQRYLLSLKHFQGGKACYIPEMNSTVTNHWGLSGATFFAMTLVTTVGYGTYTPSTAAGKAFSVVYSIMGIIIFGQCLSVVITSVWLPLFEAIHHRVPHLKRCCTSTRLTFVLICLITVVPFMMLSSLMLMARESWTFWESMYFMWITFSTIGLGDMAPTTDGPFDVLILVVHCVLGLSLIAALLGYMTNVVHTVQAHMATVADINGDGEISVKDFLSLTKRWSMATSSMATSASASAETEPEDCPEDTEKGRSFSDKGQSISI